MTLREIYEQSIKPLPPHDRLRLASFILNDIASGTVDVSEEWSETDMREFAAAGWNRIDQVEGESHDAEAR